MISYINKTIGCYILACILLLVSCDKVIDLNLKNAPSKYVIEGEVTNIPGPYIVRISKTIPFYNPNLYPGVAGAIVTIKDNTGFQEILTDNGNGIYKTNKLIGKQGNTYYLSVKLHDTTYTAMSTMPAIVPFDSIYIDNQNFTGKVQKMAFAVFKDPIAKGNNYLFNQYINGILDKTIYIDNDEYSNGQKVDYSLMRPNPDSTLKVGDNVIVEMQTIDSEVYKYWFSVDQSASGSGDGIPSNPVSNIKGGVLGYFSAHTSQRKEIKVVK